MQDIIKKDDLNCKQKCRKTYNFCKNSLPIAFLRDLQEGHLSIKGADNKESNFADQLKNFDKGTKTLDKKSFLHNFGLLFSTKEKVLNSFKSRLFPIKNVVKIPTRKPTPEPATEPEVAREPTKATKAKIKRKISSLKLHEELLKNINKQIFKEYFGYESPSFLVKDLYESKQNKNDMIVKYLNESLIDLRNNINIKIFLKMKILKK